MMYFQMESCDRPDGIQVREKVHQVAIVGRNSHRRETCICYPVLEVASPDYLDPSAIE